jgi:cell division protein FtsQ
VTRPPWPGDEQAPVSVADPSAPSGRAGPQAPAATVPGQRAQPDTSERPPKQSLARSRSPWRTAFYGVAVVGLLVAVGWVLLGSKLLVVRSVEVTGNHLVSAGQVRAAAGITQKVPMIRVNTQAAARRVEGIDQIQSATVSKSWPDRIVVTVHERTSALAVASGLAPGTDAGGYDLVDQSGVVVRSVKTRPPGMPVYQTSAAASSLRGNPAVAAAVTVLHELPGSLARSVTAVSATNADDVKLGLSDGVTIVWGDTGQAKQKDTELTVLMRTHASYYDVSAPGTAVTK